ncbi:MAG: hypothetical protein WB780_21290 [Candidatus Acidiferrales bacterium]
MPKIISSKIVSGLLWVATVLVVGIGGYFAGWSAEAKLEDVNTRNAPLTPEVRLEEQGRYDEAIQVVLDKREKEGLPEADTDWQVSLIYLERAKKDVANRERWAQQAASYLDKAVALAPQDIFILQNAMDGFDRVGDYSENGCPDYEKSVSFGEAAIGLLQGSTIRIRGISGNDRIQPTQPIRDVIQPQLKKVGAKLAAWCRKTS